MRSYSIRSLKRVRLMGRFDKEAQGFGMLYNGASAEMRIKGSCLDVEIEARQGGLRHYISFVVDGLVAQTFSPLPGKQVYTVFLNMDPSKTHDVLILKETMDFLDTSCVTLHRVMTDGKFMPLKKKATRIEFIGDSITAGEGVRGPKKFSEWLPMAFGTYESYSRLAAEKLRAVYQNVAVSGWGIHNSWDNYPQRNLPSIYDQLSLSLPKPYDFDFDPDAVVIALGTNDNGSLNNPAGTDENGTPFRLTRDAAGFAMVHDSALAFLRHLHEVNSRARLLWILFHASGMVHDAIEKAVSEAAAEGIDVRFDVPILLDRLPRGGMGSRLHPGPVAHRVIAARVAELLK